MTQDNKEPQVSDENAEFVMPEGDGFESGVPFDSDKEGHHENYHSGQNQAQSNGASESVGNSASQVHLSNLTTTGMTIKTKLLASLAIMTMIIIVLGLVSVFTIKELNTISSLVSQQYVELAKVTESIKTNVYKLRDAEKDFLLLEEQESLDRASRYTDKLRQQIEQARQIGMQIESISGAALSTDFDTMDDSIDSYESKFSAQVKDVKLARENISEEANKVVVAGKNLQTQLTDLLSLSRFVSSEHWASNKLDSKSREVINAGLALEAIEKQFLNIQYLISAYQTDNNRVYAENARKSINSSLELINRVRQSDGSTQKVKASMDNMYNLLGEYESVFQFSVDEVSRVNAEKVTVENRISNQKLGLKTIGDSFIASSATLSENSWRSINNESAQLAKSGSDAQYLLSIVAIAGVVMGLLVLFIVPRPILNGISQLLSSAQQVASGNLGAEIHINSNDELGVLGKTFEHMRQNLFVLVQRIQRASVQISSSVNEIQAASNQQSSTATEQASAVNQFSRSLEQISQNAATLVEATSDVADSSDKVASMVADSNSQAGQMMDSMNSIGESTKQTSARIKMLNEQMDSISETVSEISMIADQTTLLALNAAIEANKAGEMGKGFSVVATEIRRLSDRSIESASGIASIVKDIQRNTESSVVAMEKSSEEIKSGVNLVHNTSTNMSSINHSISQVSGKSKQILRSVRAQSESSSSVRSSATELLQSANMVSQAARQTNAISYELNSMANQLASAVSAFKL